MAEANWAVRYERKFLADDMEIDAVLSVIRSHPALFREPYPARFVNNIYLDTPALSSYRAHVRGATDRAKTRVRWYGEAGPGVAAPALERKIRRGEVGVKATYPLPPFCGSGRLARLDMVRLFRTADLPQVLSLVLCDLEPTLTNRYLRHYFQTQDGRFRVTVDHDLRFGGAGGAYGSPADDAFGVPGTIVELKFLPDDAFDASSVAQRWPFRLARCSKYVLGIEMLCDRQIL